MKGAKANCEIRKSLYADISISQLLSLARLFTETFSRTTTIHPGIFLGRGTMGGLRLSTDEHYRFMWSIKTNRNRKKNSGVNHNDRYSQVSDHLMHVYRTDWVIQYLFDWKCISWCVVGLTTEQLINVTWLWSKIPEGKMPSLPQKSKEIYMASSSE